MLAHVHTVEALDREYRQRVRKEAENTRQLRKLAANRVAFKENRPKKPLLNLKWLAGAQA